MKDQIDTPQDQTGASDERIGGTASPRRAHLDRWLRRHLRRLSAGLGLGTLTLPLLAVDASAQGEGFVNAASLDGVANVAVGPDGSATLTLANGQTVVVPAAQVQVVGGQVLISAAAAESIAALAVAAGAAGTGLGAAFVGAGLVGAAAAGGGGGSEAETGPAIFLDSFGDGVLNAEDVLVELMLEGGSREIEDGTVVEVDVRDSAGDSVLPEVILTDLEAGRWTATVDASLLEGLADGSYSVRVRALDEDGNEIAATGRPLLVDQTPPAIAIDTIAGDDILNAAERGATLTISGTTDAEDGQVVTVTFAGSSYTGTVAGGEWSVSVPAADMAGLADGAELEVIATVSDAAGNPAAPAMRTLATDLTAPTIAIDDPLAGDNVFSKINEAEGLEVTGSTDAEAGQVVTVSYNGVDYPSDPLTGATWSVTIPAAAFAGVETGDTLSAITARVSDAAGNPSAVAVGPTIGVDLTGPTITIDPIAGDDIINIVEGQDNLTIGGMTTNVDEGTTVNLSIEKDGGVFTASTTVQADGSWSINIPGPTFPTSDGQTFTVTANVTDGDGIAAVPAVRSALADFTAPTIAIDTPVAGDDVLNLAEQGEPLTLTGTTTAEDGQEVTVGFAGTAFIATAAAGAWSVTIPTSLLATLPTGATVPITANVSDVAGNPATEAEHDIGTDFVPPVIAIDLLAGDDVITLANTLFGLTISGTTDAEDGREVTVGLAGESLVATVAAGAWSVDLSGPEVQALGLEDGASVSVTATVSDAAGNPADPAIRDAATDFTAPTVSVAAIAGDDVINAAEAGAAVAVTGTTTLIEAGQ